MNVNQVVEHFGGIADVARALGISYQAVQQWVDKGEVPEGRQWQLQAMTNSELRANTESAA